MPVSVTMRSRVEIDAGDTLLYPYSIEVVTGEPSENREFHATHNNQNCTVLRVVSKSRDSAWLTVRFSDGAVREMNTDFLIFKKKKKGK